MRRFATLALVLLVAGCTTLEPPPDTDWQQHQQRTVKLQQWVASGKAALRSPDRADSANLHWRQLNGSSDIRLSGPLGAGATRIQADNQAVRVTQGNSEQLYSIEEASLWLADNQVSVPLHSLNYWLRGLPAPDIEVEQQQVDGGVLVQLQQQGWLIEYAGYRQFGPYLLPGRLKLTSADQQLRFIIKHWKSLE